MITSAETKMEKRQAFCRVRGLIWICTVTKNGKKKGTAKSETERNQKPGFRYSDGSVHSACEPCRLVRDLQFSDDGLSYGRRAVDRPDVRTPPARSIIIRSSIEYQKRRHPQGERGILAVDSKDDRMHRLRR